MPYTRITKTKSASASIDYLRGHDTGHNGYLLRNQMMSGVNMLPDGAMPFEVQMAKLLRHKSSRNKTEGWRVIQSFGPGELDADEPSDVAKAHEIGIRLAEEMWPGFEVAVFTQSDGKGHKLHNHLFVCNVNKETYKGCDHNQTFHPRIQEKSDEICAQFFDIPEPEKADDKVPRTVRAKREINAQRVPEGEEPIYIWQDDLKSRISEAALEATDFESFQEELISRGVEIDIKQPTKKHPERVITYELVDTTKFDEAEKIPRNLKCRSYKLGADYEYPRLEEQFEENGKMLGIVAGKGILVSSEVYDRIRKAMEEEEEKLRDAEKEEKEKTTAGEFVEVELEKDAPKEGLETVPDENLQKSASEADKEEEKDAEIVEKENDDPFRDKDGSKRLSYIGRKVNESIQRQFNTDEESARELGRRFILWQQDREELGLRKPFYQLTDEGSGLLFSQKGLDSAVGVFRKDMMAELTYQARHGERDRESSNAEERRRQALAKKAIMEQLNAERMNTLSADARHLMREKQRQQQADDEKQ